ncbi:MAG TPA: alpha-amylase family glycosyl hydrolase [Anaerolineae bacterium]
MPQDFLWWRDGVIYQIYPRSFADSNGDGVGDLRGIRSRLDYLRDLGVDAIWLSPIYPSPMKDFGYDVADYCSVDPVFGALADFDDLLRQAHARGIRVILDMVMNHTSDQHPWFIESRSSRDNPKRDWYIWRDPSPSRRPWNRHGGPPNNWASVFGGSAWEFDAKTGQSYLHLFVPGQPDLNWRNPEVKQALFDACRFWLDRGVDGFRLDVAHMFYKHPDLPDAPPKLGLRGFDRQHHFYYEHLPETHTLWKEFRRLLDEYSERAAVGEVAPDAAADYYGNGNDELHLAFNFSPMGLPWNPRAIQRAVVNHEARLPAGAWPCWVLSNHDVTRHISRWGSGALGDARARVAATLLLTLRGTPFTYYGEEIGMRQANIPRAEIVDPPGKRYWPFYKGRDGCRTPMHWNDGPHGGFGAGKPWLRLSRDVDRINVQRQQGEPESLLNFYRRLIALRRSNPALQRGSFRALIDRPSDVMAYLREVEGQAALICLNFASDEAKFDLRLAGGGEWRALSSSVTHSGEGMKVTGEMTLYPNEALVLGRTA